MWSKVVRLSRTVQESSQRKDAGFLLLNRRSQWDINEDYQTVGGIWDVKEMLKNFGGKRDFRETTRN